MMNLKLKTRDSKKIKHGMTYKEVLMTNSVMEDYKEDITNRVESMTLKYKDKVIRVAELEVDYLDLMISETDLMEKLCEKYEFSLNYANETIKTKKDIGEYLGRCMLYVENFISKNDKTGLKKLQQEEEELFQRVSKLEDKIGILIKEESKIINFNHDTFLTFASRDIWLIAY